MGRGVYWVLGIAMGCGGPPLPMDEVCEDACLEGRAALVASVPPGGTLLTATEYQRLADDLIQLREGVQPLAALPFGVCRGAQPCTSVLASQDLLPVAPGDYTLAAGLKVPAVGQWVASLRTTCIDAKGGLVFEDETDVSLKPDAQGEMWLRSLLTFSAPPRGAWAGADRCMFGLFTEEPAAAPFQALVSVQFEVRR